MGPHGGLLLGVANGLITTMQIENSGHVAQNYHHLERTCILNTEYVGTLDFQLEPEDKNVPLQEGRHNHAPVARSTASASLAAGVPPRRAR